MAKKSVFPAKGDFTPMIDCIFLLLIFFMCATTFKMEEKQLSSSGAAANKVGPQGVPPVTVAVSKDGSIILNNGKIQFEALGTEIETLMNARTESDRKVLIDGRAASYGRVMKVINVCSKKNVKNISFKIDNM